MGMVIWPKRVTTFHGTGRTGPVDICADAFRKPFLEGIPPKRREENAKMSRPFLKGTRFTIVYMGIHRLHRYAKMVRVKYKYL